MRGPANLEVGTSNSRSNDPANDLEYDLDATPRSSLFTTSDDNDNDNGPKAPPPTSTLSEPTASHVSPSIPLMFSSLHLRHRVFILLPAMLTAGIVGCLAPFMTFVIGQVFDAFAHFPIMSIPTQAEKDRLLHDVGLGAIELLGLGVGSIGLSSLSSSLWIWVGELNVLSLRRRVYKAVASKGISWFDKNMGADEESQDQGTGGFIAKFTAETDDVRIASSLASGMLVQYLTTAIACFVLAFMRSWALTLVILSAVPALIIIQSVSQAVAGPLLAAERGFTTSAGTVIDRAINAISTAKAFNAEQYEHSKLAQILATMRKNDMKLNAVWGVTSGLSQFSTMAMFVQAFWFGAKLVRDKKIASGDVVAVFWACLTATSSLQMCIPQFIVLAKGKFAAASLLSYVDVEPVAPPSKLASPLSKSHHPGPLKKIVPSRCYGELALHDVTFSYPSRPSVPVLRDVNLYLPAGETTFIVGGSGSGKSTIAQLLLRMYSPQSGSIHLDNQELAFLSEGWTKEHIGAVLQTSILFDMSVHDNVAIGLAGSGTGRTPADVSRKEVVNACTSALLHEFVRDLPDGYNTMLGTGGSTLSGGQMQRLSIARAKLRDPSVLILDEATSALDPTSRILVFEAIKHWRKDKTTIVITHDLSQIVSGDFVYVLHEGTITEQGYRCDLEKSNGEFRRMMRSQIATGGFLPTKEIPTVCAAAPIVKKASNLSQHSKETEASRVRPLSLTSENLILPSLRPLSFGSWTFDAVAELAARGGMVGNLSSVPSREELYSLHFTPTALVFPRHKISNEEVLTEAAALASARRQVTHSRTRSIDTTPTEKEKPVSHKRLTKILKPLTVWEVLRDVFPSIPNKPALYFGLFLCIAGGAMTPIFSFFLARLIVEVSTGAKEASTVNLFGGVVLVIAAIDGMILGLKYFVLESSAGDWVNCMRRTSYKLVLAQGRKWFDKPGNSPLRLVQILIKDGDDARNLISVVLAQAVVVSVMLSVGLIWAMIRGWQLTLAGIAVGPVFAGMMTLQSRLVSRCQLRNKRAGEDVAKTYHEAISNVRGIRAMALDSVFENKFNRSAEKALSMGMKGAFIEGCTYGLATGLIYIAEAVLFYVGAVLISQRTYSYLQMIEVLNLVVFSIAIGSQLLVFTEKIATSVNATRDLNTLLQLSTSTEESRGVFEPYIDGGVLFRRVDFSYPERPNYPVLRNLNLEIFPGECIAIVGSSGSGKSTIAALLQRLYEPDRGSVYSGLAHLGSTEVHHLRRRISVVSQHPHLFDASISENIKYGNPTISDNDVIRAAKDANAHEFIKALPHGYETMIGENASQISGGQAQRLQIARALARRCKILILDECTSALDSANESSILNAIRRVKTGRTVIMITHKLACMKMCDRILVIDRGRVAEEGRYEDLMQRKGTFAALASGGEWVG